MKTALITGDKGFIGSHLTRELKAQGVKVLGCDLKDGKEKDIRVREYWLPDADICFHLAARTDARSSDLEEDVRTNVLGTLYVLQQYQDRVVFASSSAVNYPITSYAITKLAGEKYCEMYNARIVRLCNIHGEGGHGVINAFMEQATLQIAGDGHQIRTYAPVEKAVEMLIKATGRPPGSLDILYGRDMSVNDVADRYFREKPRQYTRQLDTDINDGRQICP